MLKKIVLTLILIIAGSVTASAQEYEYIGLQGSWWNPTFSGEGFAIEEYDDGFLIAYWYTYDQDGNQLWLIGTGQRTGNTVELEMYSTKGGRLADPESPEMVSEIYWGRVILDIEDCGKINMSYESDTGLSGGYQIVRLRRTPYATGLCYVVSTGEGPEEPPPEEDPPVEDPPPEDDPPVDITITMEKVLPGGSTLDVPVPLTGLAVIHQSVSAGVPRIVLFRLKLFAEQGDVVIESITTTESTGTSFPSVEGLYPGMVIPEGTDAVFTLESNTTGGERLYPEYKIWIREYGELVNLTVRVSTESL